jgi:hypothetical protein
VRRRNVPVFRGKRDRRALREKRAKASARSPYRKPTLVDRASSPRGTSESWLRNSAKKRPYVSNKVCPGSDVRAAAKVSLATVYQKHSSLLTRKRMYRG